MTTASDYARGLLKERSERDKQVKVGASNLSSLCGRCLALDLAGVRRNTSNRWWLGARVGTAIHAALEEKAQQDKGVLSEQRLTIGTIPGYGEVKSTLDLYRIKEREVVDFKTTTRDKNAALRRALFEEPDEFDTDSVQSARFKVEGYWNQIHLYAMGLDKPVETCTIVFINRDGKEDKDIWDASIPYDPSRAEAVWGRALTIWAWLQGGGDPATVEAHPYCWACDNEF